MTMHLGQASVKTHPLHEWRSCGQLWQIRVPQDTHLQRRNGSLISFIKGMGSRHQTLLYLQLKREWHYQNWSLPISCRIHTTVWTQMSSIDFDTPGLTWRSIQMYSPLCSLGSLPWPHFQCKVDEKDCGDSSVKKSLPMNTQTCCTHPENS